MKKCLFPIVVAGLSVSASYGAPIYVDEFDDGDPATNPYLGNTLQDNGGNPITEADGAVHWSTTGGWGWGGSNVQSNDDFAFPVPGKKYTIEWKVGPMEVTTPSDQSWGDIRMQLNLLSKNSGQGAAASAEFWSLTAGGLGVDIAYKGGTNVYANFVAKNDAQAAASNPANAPGQTAHQIDPSQDNVFTIELTNTEASLYVNGTLSKTQPLYLWALGAGPGEEFENGFFISTRGARVSTGFGTMSVSSVTVDLSDVAVPPPPPIPSLALDPAIPGIRLISTGGQYDRQTIRTTNPEHTWVGAPGTVTYSLTIAEYPSEAGYGTVMYLVPGTGLDTSRNYPDWSQPVCAVAAIGNNANGTGYMRFSYKNHTVESNGFPGHEYWVNDNGDVYTGGEGPGADGTGKGGSIAFVNSTMMLGTWSVSFPDDTTVTITAPDGQSATGTMLPETAALFAGPLYAYFGTVPQSNDNLGLGATFSNVSVTGVANPINENFTSPLDPLILEESGVSPATIIQIIPGENRFWLHWSVPDTGYTAKKSATLTVTPAWQPLDITDSFIARGQRWKLLSSGELLDQRVDFFRLFKP